MEKEEICRVVENSEIGRYISKSDLSYLLENGESDFNKLTEPDLKFMIENRKLRNPELIGFLSLMCPLVGRSYFYGANSKRDAELLDNSSVLLYALLMGTCTAIDIVHHAPIVWAIVVVFNLVMSVYTRYCTKVTNTKYFMASCSVLIDNNGSDAVKDFIKNQERP